MKLITGVWTDARGNPASHGKLFAYLNQDAVAIASNQIVPRQTCFQLDIQGELGPDARIWANDELSPVSTYYRFAVLDLGGGMVWGPEFMVLAGDAPLDFDSLVPIGGIPPVFGADGGAITGPVLVSISPGSGSVGPSGSLQFTATVTNSANQAVIWYASLGSISSSGLYTAPATVAAATTVTIRATSIANPSSVTETTISIQPPTVVSVAISPASATLQSNQTLQFSATVSNVLNVAVTWSATLGTISSAGLYTAPDVTVITTVTITATSVADTTKSAHVSVIVAPTATQGPIDLLGWMGLTTRATQHLVGDPNAPYSAFVMDIDPNYPAAYPAGVYFFIKNKLGNPWDMCKYNADYALMHWITENGDAVDQPACQAANGTSCWLYARAYKRYLNAVPIMPRTFTPGTTITIDSPSPNDVARTTNCEATSTTVHIGDVRGVTSGPFKYTWGGSVDHGAGTGTTGPTLDSVNGVDTIKNEYFFSGTIANNDFLDREETYYVQGIGRVAWYYYHRATASSPWVWQNQTVNTTLASGGSPVPNFPCGPGKSWF